MIADVEQYPAGKARSGVRAVQAIDGGTGPGLTTAPSRRTRPRRADIAGHMMGRVKSGDGTGNRSAPGSLSIFCARIRCGMA